MDYKFRFTFSTPLEQVSDDLVKELIGMLVLSPERYTVGFESLDKYGESTQSHMHVHWTTVDTTSLDALRKRFQRWCKSNETHVNGRKGNALYSLTHELDVKDHERFFRYPWKQYSSIVDLMNDMRRFSISLFDKSQIYIDKHRELAYEEWSLAVDRNRSAREKLMRKQEGRDELFLYLEEWRSTIQTEKDVLMLIMKFYVEKEKSANKNTLLGYTYTACLKFGIISYSELASRWLE